MRDTDENPCLMDNTLLELFMICLVLPRMFRQTQMPDHVPHHRRKTTKQIGVNPSLFMLNPYIFHSYGFHHYHQYFAIHG